MKIFKNKTFVYILVFVLCGILAFVLYYFVADRNNKDLSLPDDVIDNSVTRHSSLEKLVDLRVLNIKVGNKIYNVTLDDNTSVDDILSLGEFSILFEDYGEGYKEGYLSSSISFNPSYTGQISMGDIVVSDSNKIRIYYTDAVVDEVYVKIGNVKDLLLESGSMEISFINK